MVARAAAAVATAAAVAAAAGERGELGDLLSVLARAGWSSWWSGRWCAGVVMRARRPQGASGQHSPRRGNGRCELDKDMLAQREGVRRVSRVRAVGSREWSLAVSFDCVAVVCLTVLRTAHSSQTDTLARSTSECRRAHSCSLLLQTSLYTEHSLTQVKLIHTVTDSLISDHSLARAHDSALKLRVSIGPLATAFLMLHAIVLHLLRLLQRS